MSITNSKEFLQPKRLQIFNSLLRIYVPRYRSTQVTWLPVYTISAFENPASLLFLPEDDDDICHFL